MAHSYTHQTQYRFCSTGFDVVSLSTAVALFSCRHPEPQLRPKFRDVVQKLMGNRSRVLDIPQLDLETHSEAGRLGAELDAGLMMYKDLQDSYGHV